MAEETLEVTLLVPADTPISELVTGDQRLIGISERNTTDSTERNTTDSTEPSHTLVEGRYAVDANEPTPSSEANTVKVLRTTGERADEYVVEATGQTVAEHNPNFPKDDPVVIGRYPNMSDPGKQFAFPESRLREM